MDRSSEKRAAQRSSVRAPVEYAGDEIQGTGISENVSVSGLLIEHVSSPVALGQELRIRLSLFQGSFDTEFRARVVRITEEGFAIQFLRLDPAQMEVLLTSLPKRSGG